MSLSLIAKNMKPNLENYEKFKELHLIEHDWGYLLWKHGTDDNVEIEDILAVEQRKGYGTQMMKELIGQCSPKLIFVYTKSGNTVAQAFYEAMGMQKGGELDDNWIYWQHYNILKNKLCKNDSV